MSNFAVTFSVARSAHFARDKTTNGYSFRRTFEFRRIFLGFDKPRGGIRHSPLLAQASSSVGISRGRTSSARTLGVGSKLEALKFGLYDREDFVTADCCILQHPTQHRLLPRLGLLLCIVALNETQYNAMSLTSNYLDHLDGRLEKQGGRGSVARLLLVARKGDGADDSDAVVRYHERVRKAANSF